MRNLNDIEAKTILLLTEIENQISNGAAVPWQIVIAASKVKQAIAAEDAALGADLVSMANQWRKAAGSDTN